jgi:hypothetical protein
MGIYNANPIWSEEVTGTTTAKIMTMNDPSQFSDYPNSWLSMQKLLRPSEPAKVNKIVTFNGVASFAGGSAPNNIQLFKGAIYDLESNLYLIPFNINTIFKLSENYSLSTLNSGSFSLSGYCGGVLAPNGDVHFIPSIAKHGLKINKYGVVSTYNLIYKSPDSFYDTVGGEYVGGVLAPNGDIHFVPYLATIGQKISTTANTSTTYTTSSYAINGGGYAGGVLTPNGEVHFIPKTATVGQKITLNGDIITYQFPNNFSYPYSNSYSFSLGSSFSFNGDSQLNSNNIIRSNGTPDTGDYSLSFYFAVTSGSGDIYYRPNSLEIRKTDGSLYQLINYNTLSFYTGPFILNPNGTIMMTPYNSPAQLFIFDTNELRLLPRNVYFSQFFNKSF